MAFLVIRANISFTSVEICIIRMGIIEDTHVQNNSRLLQLVFNVLKISGVKNIFWPIVKLSQTSPGFSMSALKVF